MRVAIRPISIASAVSWVLLIGFAVSALVSMKDFQLEFGALQTSIGSRNDVVFVFPLGIVNKGFYGISDFKFSSEMVDDQGLTLARGSTLVPLIGTGQTVNSTHEIDLRFEDLLNGSTRLLFDDVDLCLAETFSMKAAELIPVQASSNTSISWGAPLNNFALGAPKVSEFVDDGGTYVAVVVPVSFENHAFFSLNGTLLVHVYNDVNEFIGEGQTSFNVLQESSFHKNVTIEAVIQNVTSAGYCEVFIETPLFSVGPLVFPYD